MAFLNRQPSGLPSWAALSVRRDSLSTASARGRRIASYSPSAVARSPLGASRSASTTGSSIAWAAPWPTPGVVRLGDSGDRLVPAGEAPQDLRLLPFGLVRLAFRSVLRREPVRVSAPD